MSQKLFFAERAPVPAAQARIVGVGVNPLDLRRVDVAVDLTPCLDTVRVEMAIVGPQDDELSSATMVDNREWQLDRVMHLCRDAEPGVYTLHVGIFHEDRLIHREARQYLYPPPTPAER